MSSDVGPEEVWGSPTSSALQQRGVAEDPERGAATDHVAPAAAAPAVQAQVEKPAAGQTAASLTFRGLAFSAVLPGGERKVVLEPCSGHFEPGQLVALMGPSGSGKTTLLDMLAMKKTAAFEGEVLVNGHPRDRRLFPRIAAYVSQEDVMPAHWKVREAVMFNAGLKCTGASWKSCRQVADSLLDAFDLLGVAETYIGGPQVRGISGGQRRRVSLARGVAAQASLLFADEPTSGLSATDAELCIRALRGLAKQLNMLAILVIHQPRKEVAELFDSLILLTSNPGRMTYCGPMANTVPYMRELGLKLPVHIGNPADLFLDLVTPGGQVDASDALVAAFRDRQQPSIEAQCKLTLADKGQTIGQMLQATQDLHVGGDPRTLQGRGARMSPYAVAFRRQFSVLLRRKLLITVRNPQALALQVFLPLGMGNVLGAVFQGVGAQPSLFLVIPFLFILLTMLGLQSLPILPLLIAERDFMKRETSERLYTEVAAVLINFCVDAPLGLLVAFSQATIIYAYSGLAHEYFWTVMGWVLLLYSFYDAVFSCMAAAAPDPQQALSQSVPVVTIFMLFNGFIISRASAPVWLRWVFQISPNAYALEGVLCRMAPDYGGQGKMIMSTYEYRADHAVKGIVVMLCMIALFRSLQVLALRRLNNVQR